MDYKISAKSAAKKVWSELSGLDLRVKVGIGIMASTFLLMIVFHVYAILGVHVVIGLLCLLAFGSWLTDIGALDDVQAIKQGLGKLKRFFLK